MMLVFVASLMLHTIYKSQEPSPAGGPQPAQWPVGCVPWRQQQDAVPVEGLTSFSNHLDPRTDGESAAVWQENGFLISMLVCTASMHQKRMSSAAPAASISST